MYQMCTKPKGGFAMNAIKKMEKQSGFRLFLLILPLLMLVFVFSYMPLYGWIYAFFNYKPGKALFACEFVGLDNFKMMFADSYAVKKYCACHEKHVRHELPGNPDLCPAYGVCHSSVGD